MRRLLSVACFAAPLALLYALQGLSAKPAAIFVALCCGVGLATGVEASRAHDSESLLPQAATSDGCRFKSDLGLSYDESSLVRDHVNEFKYLSLLLFLLRLVVNLKALSLNTLAICTKELPVTVGSVARVLEAGIFLEHLCKLPCEMIGVLLGASPCGCLSTVKTLAGFSSMRFLRFLNKRHVLNALKQIAKEPKLLQGGLLMLLGVIYSLLLAGFGLAVLLSKLQSLNVHKMEELQVPGLLEEALKVHSFGAFMASDVMQLVSFANQVASAMNIQEEELQRLLSFLLGDGKKGSRFLDQAMRNFMKLPRWRWRLVALFTFDAAGLQKLVRDKPH